MPDRLTLLRTTVVTAGEAILRAAPGEGVVRKEGRANIVTAADLASERTIIDAIRDAYPGDAILSEETETDLGDLLALDRLWVIDPLDGTNNFRHSRRYSAVSIGYVERGTLRLGGVYDPFSAQLFLAARGDGATLNDQRIMISSTSNLAEASLATGNSYEPAGTRHNLELALRLPVTPWMLIKGSAVLEMCEVAAGRIDAYFHTFLKPWDNAAAFLIAQESGARIVGLGGEQVTFLTQSAVVGNPDLVRQIVTATSRAG